MVGKLMDLKEGVKDKLLGAATYKTTVKTFDDAEDFAKNLVTGDRIVTGVEIGTVPSLGVAAGTQHEVDRVEGDLIILKGGKRITAEWFVPQVTRRERVRQKVNRANLLVLAADFAARRWADFKVGIDKDIEEAKVQVTKAQTEVERSQNRLKQVQDAVVKLEQAKVGGEQWPEVLAASLVSLVDQKLFTNFEIIEDGVSKVFIAYTGPIEVVKVREGERKLGDGDPTTERGEFAIKVYEPKAMTRVVIENVAPGKLPTDVPFNENRGGASNVCFGDQGTEIESLIKSEDWRRLLIMIRSFLEGNRKN
jgi:hypothetical protein